MADSAIWFYSSREQAVTNPKVYILISLKGSHLNPGKSLKSGRVEITARVVALPVRGKHTPVLTEIRRVDELPVESEHSP